MNDFIEIWLIHYSHTGEFFVDFGINEMYSLFKLITKLVFHRQMA